jgi:hypothetical protein
MKRIDYFWPRTLVQLTAVVFWLQLTMEMSGVITRKPGYGWVLYACAGAFVASVLYFLAAMVLNAWRALDGDA